MACSEGYGVNVGDPRCSLKRVLVVKRRSEEAETAARKSARQ